MSFPFIFCLDFGTKALVDCGEQSRVQHTKNSDHHRNKVILGHCFTMCYIGSHCNYLFRRRSRAALKKLRKLFNTVRFVTKLKPWWGKSCRWFNELTKVAHGTPAHWLFQNCRYNTGHVQGAFAGQYQYIFMDLLVWPVAFILHERTKIVIQSLNL